MSVGPGAVVLIGSAEGGGLHDRYVPTGRARVRVLTDDGPRQRLQEVTEKLSRRFRSLDREPRVRTFISTPIVMPGLTP